MSNEVPAGYMTMTVAVIRLGTTAARDDYKERITKWCTDTHRALVVWRGTPGWWQQFKNWMNDVPPVSDPDALFTWYDKMSWWNRPDIPGVDSEPHEREWAIDWARRVENCAAEETVFINVDDARLIRSWAGKATTAKPQALNEGPAS